MAAMIHEVRSNREIGTTAKLGIRSPKVKPRPG
jgi:hypothetical protein